MTSPSAGSQSPWDTAFQDKIPSVSLFTSLKFYSLAIFIRGWNSLTRTFNRGNTTSEYRPDIVKRYETHRYLPINIFFPRSYDRTSPKSLPLLFTVHGGGFAIGEPSDNNGWNSTFANAHGALVVGLNYSKAPFFPFPRAVYDLEALIVAALADPELTPHIDSARVALLGWSAGGNLVLAAAQLPTVRAAVAALIPMYPVADMSLPRGIETHTRRYKPSLGGFRARDTDYLMALAGLFDWAYIAAGHDSRDPLLSPVYAKRADLPRRVFLVGCEMDQLAHGAWRLACKLAGREVPGLLERVGREETGNEGELVLDDEKFYFRAKSECADYMWLLVPDTIHGFDHDLDGMVNDEVLMKDARAKTVKVMQMIGDWLYSGQHVPSIMQ